MHRMGWVVGGGWWVVAQVGAASRRSSEAPPTQIWTRTALTSAPSNDDPTGAEPLTLTLSPVTDADSVSLRRSQTLALPLQLSSRHVTHER